jgi:kynurenine 3-monooxygenase
MNSGFEDISILNEMMEKYGDDWEMIFSEYHHVSPMLMLLQNSYRNFMEMSSKTADDKFSCKRKLKNGFQTSTLISGFHFIVGSHLVTVLMLKL